MLFPEWRIFVQQRFVDVILIGIASASGVWIGLPLTRYLMSIDDFAWPKELGLCDAGGIVSGAIAGVLAILWLVLPRALARSAAKRAASGASITRQ
jgi:hypothetical protein